MYKMGSESFCPKCKQRANFLCAGDGLCQICSPCCNSLDHERPLLLRYLLRVLIIGGVVLLVISNLI